MTDPTPVLVHGITGEALLSQQRTVDGQAQDARLFSRGEQAVINLFNDTKGLVNEGSYFVASTPTPGTGITLSVATGTTYSDTQGLLSVDNLDTGKIQGGQSKQIYLDFISFVVTATPTAATQHDIAYRIDNANRGTGGTVVAVQNANMAYGNATMASIRANPTIAAATANVRTLGHQTIRKAAAPAYIVGDLVIIKFGGIEMSNALANFTLTTQTIIIVPAPPVAIGPGQSFILNEWATARTGALSGEISVGFVER